MASTKRPRAVSDDEGDGSAVKKSKTSVAIMSELHASNPVLEAQNGDHDEEEKWQPPTQGRHVRKGTECPYLDTISRQVTHPCSPGMESMLSNLTLHW